MQTWIDFAKGPLFAVTFTFMVVGLGRHIVLQTLQLRRCVKRLAIQKIAVGKNIKEMARWMIPVGRVHSSQPLLTVMSVLLHMGLLLVPLFLADHIAMWYAALGVRWPGLPPLVADGLTLMAIVAATILFGWRLLEAGARNLISASDYCLLATLVVSFGSGFMAMHPAVNPLAYNMMLLIHVLSAELVFVLIPTTKLAHCVLFPFLRFSSDIFWRMPSGAGEKVARELHGKDVCV